MRSKKSNVIPIRETRISMQYPLINEVEAYWEALRDGKRLPERAQVDPRGIDRALRNAFVAERIAPGVARFRVAGQHLHELMGMDVRGMPLSAFFMPGARDRMAGIVEEIFTRPQVSRVGLAGARGMGRPVLEGMLLLLPLLNDKGEVSRMMGCLVTEGGIGRVPRRFDVATVTSRDLATGERAHDQLFELQHATHDGFAEPPVGFGHRPPKGPNGERPALRLVQSDD